MTTAVFISAHGAIWAGHRFLLEEFDFGTYCFFYEREDDSLSKRDDLYDSLSDAKDVCGEDFGVPPEAWSILTNHTPLMA